MTSRICSFCLKQLRCISSVSPCDDVIYLARIKRSLVPWRLQKAEFNMDIRPPLEKKSCHSCHLPSSRLSSIEDRLIVSIQKRIFLQSRKTNARKHFFSSISVESQSEKRQCEIIRKSMNAKCMLHITCSLALNGTIGSDIIRCVIVQNLNTLSSKTQKGVKTLIRSNTSTARNKEDSGLLLCRIILTADVEGSLLLILTLS